MLDKLDKALGGIVFDSSQSAITAALEVLGSRFQPISVVMPVTVTYDALMAVIRSNARPVVVDIDPDTLQADVSQVQECLESMEDAVVLLTRPAGLPVAPSLMEAVQDVPTIVDTRVLPTELEMFCTYNVYDMSPMLGKGAVVYAKNSDICKDLRVAREDAQTGMGEVLAALGYKRLPEISLLPRGLEYSELIDKSGKSGIVGYGGSAVLGSYLVRVSDANKAQQHLAKRGVQTAFGVVPVYKYEIARKRFPQELNYPIAEDLCTKFLLLPDHEDVPRDQILDALWNL